MPHRIIGENKNNSITPKGYYDEAWHGMGNTVNTSDDDILRVFEYASSLMQNQKMSQRKNRRLGAAKGKFVCPDDIDFCNDEIAEMFGVNE